ncbi:uncharacterized protein LOC124269094 [Haliotis rubra]|uniref:uncharacterized protein LOC124269094 n=1 Tax=Haliotis rubra TaxID=36100 RepID=UPI001EE53ADB|nr:uncharacterized protein LOC124269094 [Haliotis rubra]
MTQPTGPMDYDLCSSRKNNSHHSGIKQSPFRALFGSEPKVGLRSSTLPPEILERLVTEDDLHAAFEPSTTPSATHQQDHPSSAESSSSEISQIEEQHQNSQLNRKEAADGRFAQAERMVKRSRLEHVAGNPGDNVTIPIPLVDRGKGEPRNIMGVILDGNENDLYRVAVRSGILKERYCRSQYDLSAQNNLSMVDVQTDKEIGLRQAVQQELVCGGQGYTKCNCAQNAKQCKTIKYMMDYLQKEPMPQNGFSSKGVGELHLLTT